MKNNKILQVASLILCLGLMPSMTVLAEAGVPEGYVYNDTDQPQYVEDIEEYLEQLNAGLITPSNTVITTYESTITPFSIISDPSESCSNIFGHKWENWGSWSGSVFFHSGKNCMMPIKRIRYCERTYCNAYQTETDVTIIPCNH